jgi:hypothetical protein
LSIGKIVGISALMHMDNTLKGTNVEFNKNKFRLFLGPPSYTHTYIHVHCMAF